MGSLGCRAMRRLESVKVEPDADGGDGLGGGEAKGMLC